MKPNGLTLDVTLVHDIRGYISGFLLFVNLTIYTLHKTDSNTIYFKNLTSANTNLTAIECITNKIIRMTFNSAVEMAGTHGFIILI